MWNTLVNLGEAVEALLLLKEVERGGLGGLLFEGQVHPLMASVLVWVAGLDALDLDAEPQPPDGDLGEAERRVG